MNIKKIIKIVNLLPGFDFKEMIAYFDLVMRETIINLAKKDISDKNNFIVIMTAVNNDNETIFIPVEMTPPTENKPSTVVQQFKPYNSTQIIKNTDIDKAISIYTAKNYEGTLFAALETAAIDPTKKIEG